MAFKSDTGVLGGLMKITVEKIIDIVEQYYNLPSGSIVGRKRTKVAAEARKQAMTLARKYTRHSWAELEELFDRQFMRALTGVKTPWGLKWKLFLNGVF